jgi:hypothetical protein
MPSYLTFRSYLQATLAVGVVLAGAFSPFVVSPAEAQTAYTYYVGPNGSDVRPSTSASNSTVAAGVAASPNTITSGQTAVITWTTRNAVSATLNGTPVALNGSMSVRPSATTTYKVVATRSNGSTNWGSATVTVNSASTGTGGGQSGTTPSCSGTTYYVSTSGNDSNSGTSATSPWKTVAGVVAYEPSLRPGDCVLFQRGGVWYEQLKISNLHGTQSYPITFGNYGTGNLPVLDGGSTRPYGIVGASGSGQAANSYVTIDGFEVRNATSGGIIFSYLVQPGITIQNNYVHNNGYGAYAGACSGCFQVDNGSYGYNEGIAMVCYPESSCGVKIINNVVKLEGGHNAIMVDSDHGNPLIQGNLVGPGVTHGGIDFKRSLGMMVKQNSVNCSVSVVVNGQTYPGCSATSFWTEQDDSTYTETGTYEQNVSYGAARGYACFGANGVSGPISLKYYNNTCHLGSTGANATDLTSCRGGTLTFENNIFDGSGGINLGTCSAATWDYNDKYGTAGGPSGTHDMGANPLFVNPSTMDFHLQSTSPVLNNGNSTILGVPYIGACGTSGTCP